VGNQGAIRLTTARYYTPSGRSIQAQGIEPDIQVEAARIERTAQGPQRREADLRGALRNDQGATPPATAPQPGANQQADEQPLETAQDYQLVRAIDLLRGLALYQQRAN
jgi:carboxyl-terminal processing protease